jgi:phosphotriesterase-related protein
MAFKCFFKRSIFVGAWWLCGFTHAQSVQTVEGAIPLREVGWALEHEHLLVDFVGASAYSRNRWNEDSAVVRILPFLLQAKSAGVKTLFDCTPNFLGRDARLLLRLARESGVQLVTNTGLYGGSDNKFLPAYAFEETAEQLAVRWMNEYRNGLDGTTVKPGFMKISVNPGPLSDISKKLITAAALAHLATGLSIASHTGPAVPALEQLDILQANGVRPEAFVWVHAQNERQIQKFVDVARYGAWVSLDGVGDDNIAWHVEVLGMMKKERLLKRVLISHDAGWFDPAQPRGGQFRPFTAIFEKLIPALKQAGFSGKEIQLLLQENPAQAYAVRIRK